MDVKEKNVVILGLGKSGKEAALFMGRRGALVLASDTKDSKALRKSLEPLSQYENIRVALGKQEASLITENTDLVIKSPGVPPTIPPLLEAERLGIPVLSEIETAYHFIKGSIIGITGTNGKTTTTTLVAEIIKKAGKRARLGGNIGTPLLSLVEGNRAEDILVTELSSFQLDNTKDFCPHISAVLNITADHMDYHGSLESYVEAKAKVFANQEKENFTILNFDDPLVASFKERTKARVVPFSRKKVLPEGVFLQDGNIIASVDNRHITVLPAQELALPGLHNLENCLAAVAVCMCAGISPESIAAVLRNFSGVQHRLEFVREVAGIKFVNDSKGTNPESSIKALEAYEEPIVLIAGGKERRSDFGQLAELVQKKVRHAVVLGETKEKITLALRETGFENVSQVSSLEEAVAEAYRRAEKGDVVLLSPACASWDMFESFEVRGNLFKTLVANLERKESYEKNGEKRP